MIKYKKFIIFNENWMEAKNFIKEIFPYIFIFLESHEYLIRDKVNIEEWCYHITNDEWLSQWWCAKISSAPSIDNTMYYIVPIIRKAISISGNPLCVTINFKIEQALSIFPNIFSNCWKFHDSPSHLMQIPHIPSLLSYTINLTTHKLNKK